MLHILKHLNFVNLFALDKDCCWCYFFLFNMFISRNKTSILVTLFLLLGVLIYHLITSFKKHMKAWIITLSISASIILVFSLLIFIDSIRPECFSGLYRFINDVIIHDGQVVMEDRVNKWGTAVNEVNKNAFTVIFGYGDRLSTIIIPKLIGYGASDSVYVTNYISGGLVKFLLYFLFIGYFYYSIVKNEKNSLAKFYSLLTLSIIAFLALSLSSSILVIVLSFSTSFFITKWLSAIAAI